MGRALAKRRDDRYPTGAALVADLQRALTGQRVATPPRSPTPRPTPTPTPGGTPVSYTHLDVYKRQDQS